MALVNGGLLAPYGHEEILKKSSLKPLVRFLNNFTGMFAWLTLFKILRNFDPSINMALVNGGFLHYMDMNKFLRNLLLKCWSDFEIISLKCSFSVCHFIWQNKRDSTHVVKGDKRGIILCFVPFLIIMFVLCCFTCMLFQPRISV